MPGLLDFFSGNWTDDPNQNQAIRQGLLSAAFSGLAAAGKNGNGPLNTMGQAGLGGLLGYSNAQQAAEQQRRASLQDQMLQQQLENAKRQAEQQQMQRDWMQRLPSPQMQASQAALSAGGGPTVVNAQRVPQVDQGSQMAFDAMRMGVLPISDYLSMIRKDETPMVLPEGGTLVTKSGRTLAQGTPKNDIPSAVREYQFAVGQGYPGSFAQWDMERKRAAGTNVKIENALGGGIASQVGPMMKESYETANGAQQQIGTSDQLIRAIDSGKTITGPGANLRLRWAQLAQALGVGGKDTAEQIANTRAAIQGLAQSTVAARAALKGQGQVSDYEGKLLARAASGDIEDLTAAEIKQIAQVNKRLAQTQIELHNKRVMKLRQDPNTAPLANFFDIVTPTQVPQGAVDWGSLK